MSFPLLVLADAGRTVLLAALAVGVAVPLVRTLAGLPERARPLAWALLLAPLLTPTLLVSYACAPLAVRLIGVPGGLAALHFAALLLRFVPVAVAVLHFLPPLVSAEARHCHAIFAPPSPSPWLFHLRAAGRGPWRAGGLVFLLAFADFELASLWSVKTWPVALFDAHAGGLALGASLRLAAWPLAVQLAILVALGCTRAPAPEGSWTPAARRMRAMSVAYLVFAALAAAMVPLGIVAWQALGGLPTLAENFILSRELAASLALALGAAVCARVLARAPLLCAPGLLGALVLALLVLAIFQAPGLRAAYDTPLPLLLALTLLLVPLAMLLRWRLTATDEPAGHVARLTMPHPAALLWQLEGRRRFAGFALLFYWAYFEFTASSLLAPVGLTPVFARLHNLAHYGQTAVLSAMLLAAFLAPVAVLLLTAPVARFYPRRDGR